ncbi:sulfurtransferase TusA family protein [Clostridiaceae bacterium M8S5]|nr:sulfurtransferase TusA family protein [Clostridiaceae bacterium M8S5]
MAIRELDCMYEACPIPIIKSIKELKAMDTSDILIVKTDHSCVGISLKEWAEKKDYSVEVIETENGEWNVFIEKK